MAPPSGALAKLKWKLPTVVKGDLFDSVSGDSKAQNKWQISRPRSQSKFRVNRPTDGRDIDVFENGPTEANI